MRSHVHYERGFLLCNKSSSVEGKVNIMQIYDLLSDYERYKLSEMSNGINGSRKRKTRYRANKERLTRREIVELMGTNRDRYHRVHGKVKRK